MRQPPHRQVPPVARLAYVGRRSAEHRDAARRAGRRRPPASAVTSLRLEILDRLRGLGAVEATEQVLAAHDAEDLDDDDDAADDARAMWSGSAARRARPPRDRPR